MTGNGPEDGGTDPAGRWQRLDDLLDAALDRPEGQQEAYLRDACGDDPELLEEALRLLKAARSSEGFMERAILEADTDLAREMADRLDREGPRRDGELELGTEIGSYRLEEVLGRGGLGTVYRARRTEGTDSQDVAIKVMRGLGHQEEMERRFRAEREILATLRHPHIADILGGGTLPDGRPYLVMERVDGTTLMDYCHEHRLGVEDRIRLFLQVVRAVRYAHRHLVVHRDLKPSNILVDRDGTVKLVDFGIAKLLDDDLIADPAPRTRTHFRLLTPEYAAPEQVRGAPITTATDVYQLGLLLQEILTGRKPKGAEADSPAQLERIVCEEGEDGPSAAAPSRRLRRALRGDLDTIALKALRTEPERRYASAGELAEDLERYLVGQPVGARPENVVHRVRRMVRRRPVGAAVTASLAVLALVQIVTATVYADRVAAERDVATQEAEKAQEVQTFLVELLQAAEPGGTEGGANSAWELVETGVERLDRLQADPGVYAEVLDALGDVYSSWGEWPAARPVFEEAVQFFTDEYEEDHPHLAAALNSMGHVERWDGNQGAAENFYRAAKDMRVRLHGRDHPDVACAVNNLGIIAANREDQEQAVELYEEALATLSENEGNCGCLACVQNNLGIALREIGDLERADSLHLASAALRRETQGEHHPDVTIPYVSRYRTLRRMNRWDEAAEALETAREIGQAAGEMPPARRATQLNSLGFLRWSLGDYEEAVEIHRESLDLRAEHWGWESTRVEAALTNLGASLRDAGRTEEAREVFQQTLEVQEAVFDGPVVDRSILLNHMARLELGQGNLDEARALLEESETTLGQVASPGERWPAETQAVRGWLRLAEGDVEEAEELLRDAHARLVDAHGLTEHSTREAASLLAEVHEHQGRDVEAERYRELAALPEA